MKKEGIFGDISGDWRAQRLLSIGLGLGVILGATLDGVGEIIGMAVAAAFIALRSWAQVKWPDRGPEDA